MLVISRKPSEGIIIHDRIRIRVQKRSGRFQLAIEAPEDVRILREELYEGEFKLPCESKTD